MKMDLARAGRCVLLSAVLTTTAAGTVRSEETFDGITIIDLSDQDAENVIRGRGEQSTIDTGKYLVTYVAAAGSYAALLGPNSGAASCVAWAVEGSYTGDEISFGSPPSVATINTAVPKVCQPFTLKHDGEGL